VLERVPYTRVPQGGVQGVYSTHTNRSEITSTVISENHSAQFIPPEQLTTKSNIDPAKIKFTDIFKPKLLFEKILKKFLYPAGKHGLFKLLKPAKPFEEHKIQTNNGQVINTWLALNPNPQARTKIFFHGNASNITSFQKQAQEEFARGNNACLVSYRGYSGNDGTPSQDGIIRDTNDVIDYLINNQNLKTDTIDFVAHSLGSAVVLNTLAHRTGNNPSECFGELKLIAPFKSMQGLIKNKLKFIPQFVINYLTNSWNNLEAIKKLKNKVSKINLVHGKNDSLIPYEHSVELYQEALKIGAQADLNLIDGKNHNNIVQQECHAKNPTSKSAVLPHAHHRSAKTLSSAEQS
jgi:pimeloyl-ACP methyl ester carboxylesterase